MYDKDKQKNVTVERQFSNNAYILVYQRKGFQQWAPCTIAPSLAPASSSSSSTPDDNEDNELMVETPTPRADDDVAVGGTCSDACTSLRRC